MKMTEHEKILGIETMRSRIYQWHKSRLERIGKSEEFDSWGADILVYPRNKVVKEYRNIPEGNIDIEPIDLKGWYA